MLFIRFFIPLAFCLVFTTATISLLPIVLHYYLMKDISIMKFSKNNYGSIWVYEDKNTRCMSFTHPARSRNTQTCMLLADNTVQYFKYSKMVLGSLYVQPNPKKILMIGLGGGSIVRALNFLKPTSTVEIVEINPEVVALAKVYFPFENTARTKVYIEDGFHYVQNAMKNKARYDLIIIDAFTEDYIPSVFLTPDFIHMLKKVLAPNGVAACNSFANSRYSKIESGMFKEVFGEFYNLIDGNRIIIAKNGPLPSINEIQIEASRLEPDFNKLQIDKHWLLSKFKHV